MFPESKLRETLSLRGNKTYCFLCFVIPPNSKLRRNCLLYACWLTRLMRFQGARPDHVRVESSCCCFPGELVSFVPHYDM